MGPSTMMAALPLLLLLLGLHARCAAAAALRLRQGDAALLDFLPTASQQQHQHHGSHDAHGGGSSDPQHAEQCFAWSKDYSIARDDFEYFDWEAGQRRQAVRGELIKLRCDGVVCPNPVTPDCYMNDAVCDRETEWCNLQDQVRLGPWAMADGETPNLGVGTPMDCDFFANGNYSFLFDQVCKGQRHWGPWKAVRGRCVPYRREQQSCNAFFAELPGGDPSQRLIRYVVDHTNGRPPRRALVCAPGLVCTGDVEPVPYTCVAARPPNTCFQGPWWDSSWCKIGGVEGAAGPGSAPNHFTGGLPRSVLEQLAAALIIQLPVETYGRPVDNPQFFLDPGADQARTIIQNIVQELWPEVYRGTTKFPIPVPDPRAQGARPGTAAWNATALVATALVHQPNKLWSTIHSMIHNVRDPMTTRQVRASRALAVWLRQHFGCQNCRGFWGTDVLNAVGLPPEDSSREAHKRWWWRAHNMVSEHAAATRGGHPWIWLAQTDEQMAETGRKYNDKGLIKCQNPFFLPFEYTDAMWNIPEPVPKSWL